MNLEILPFFISISGIIVVFSIWGLMTYLAVKRVDLFMIRREAAMKKRRELGRS